HSHQFMQLEGLMVVKKDGDTTASLKDLKTILKIFANEIFNQEDLDIRMRPSFFPFTEPSVEVDVSCSSCKGSGCKFCKHTGWIEVLGAGIIHKNVLGIAGYDPDLFTGYAFGIGVERIALLKHNIEDIRNIYQNDFRFIKQFNK
ncbi:MAG: phenylalanine--tRNA ligase subunit alpha, partial [Mycoplasmatales bacterium]